MPDQPSVPTGEARLHEIQRLFLNEMPALRGWFLSLLPDRSLAEDLVQETFITVIEKQDSFTIGTNFRAWMFAIARFKLLAASRRPATREIALDPETMELLMAEAPELPVGDDRIKVLRHCLGKLAPRAKQAIQLRYLKAMKPPAIAEEMGWKTEAVYVALSRARSSLRECIDRKLPKSLPTQELL